MNGLTGCVRIGISGWTYPPWRGDFFPAGLPQKRELAYAAARFRSIEINGTFYGLQKPASFARWAEETPDDFVFSIKAPRFITHVKRLRDVEIAIANFIASGPLRLGPKLGPILWQFPPAFTFDPALIEPFLALLPHDADGAKALAGRHDDHLKDRAWLKTDDVGAVRHAIEIRNESFRTPVFVELLRHYKVALVCADTDEWPRLMDITADFIYCRLHGSGQRYVSGYDESAIDAWAERIRAWTAGSEPPDGDRAGAEPTPKCAARDVYVYFDNEFKVRSPLNARSLMQRLDFDRPA